MLIESNNAKEDELLVQMLYDHSGSEINKTTRMDGGCDEIQRQYVSSQSTTIASSCSY